VQLAELWRVDRIDGRLRREGAWHGPDVDAAAFDSSGASLTHDPEDGLIGRTWTSRRAQWALDVSADADFKRGKIAAEIGLRTAVALPIVARDDVEGVLVLFRRTVDPLDEALLATLQSVGIQVGDFIARKRSEESSNRHERLAEIGTLVAKIVHDVGNPLAGISMLASRIARRVARNPDEPIESIREPIAQLGETVRRLDSLISEFKSFAREQRLVVEEVPLDDFLSDVVRSWEPEASERGISLVLGPDTAAHIDADPAKLRRVFDNLMKNALEAIDRGPGWVRIASSIPTAEKVRITVEDDGPGIPEDLRLFELFATTKAKGTGLGLAISKQILLAHGGGIQFARGPARGAAFHIELPRRRSAL
jgi:signal transduction histidine kinase